MAKFAMLTYGPTPGDFSSIPPEEFAALAGYGDKITELGGKVSDQQAFLPVDVSKSLSTGGSVQDGTFLGGDLILTSYCVLEADDMDHAVEISKHNPATWRGGVEIRPLFEAPAE